MEDKHHAGMAHETTLTNRICGSEPEMLVVEE
jgi:hypothetical protein